MTLPLMGGLAVLAYVTQQGWLLYVVLLVLIARRWIPELPNPQPRPPFELFLKAIAEGLGFHLIALLIRPENTTVKEIAECIQLFLVVNTYLLVAPMYRFTKPPS